MAAKKTDVISGLRWTAGGKLAAQLVTWCISIVVIRLLAPSDYGLLAMASVFIAFFLLVSEVGLGPALIQRSEISDEVLRQGFGVVLIVNFTLLIALNLLAPEIADFFDDERLVGILRVLSLQFPIIALTVLPDVRLQRSLDFKSRSVVDFIGATLSAIVTLGMALTGFGVWSLVMGSLLAAAFKAVAVNYLTPLWLRPTFCLRGMRSLLSFGGNVTATRVIWFLYTQADTVIVGRLLGKEALGFYSVAMHLASLPVQRVSGILNQVVFPVFSRMQHDRDAIVAQVSRALKLLCLFSFPILWGISSVANDLVLLVLGKEWESAVLPLQVLAVIMPLRMLANFLPSAADALGRPQVALNNVIVASLIMPAAFYIGSGWGLIGVSVAWLTAFPIVMLINIRRTALAVGLELSLVARAIAPSFFSASVMYCAVWMTGQLFGTDFEHLVCLIAKIFVGVAVYTGMTLLTNRNMVRETLRLLS